MANTIPYDLDDHLFSPSPDAGYRCYILGEDDSPNIFDLSNTDTKSEIDSSNSNNSSPPQLLPYSPNLSVDYPGVSLNENELVNFSQPTEKLRILAQPKAFYRERYCSETDPNKHRAQRFIRADDDTTKYEYPTVQIPPKWCDPNRDLYIRVTLVTIFSEKVPVVCIHPYAIDTQDNDVLQDPRNSSLYFPIISEDILTGQKSFRISRKKMIQHDLRAYGPLHLFDLNQSDIQRIANSHDAKQIIETYQLWKSQLVFTIAERLKNDYLPIPICFTSVTSQIMCDDASVRRRESLINNSICEATFEDDSIKCAPQKGDWNGGDGILMVIPKLDKRKVLNIYFDYGSMGRMGDIKLSFVDLKTIFFQTPPCPMLAAEQNLTVPLIVTQNDIIIARIDFVYLTPIRITTNLCPRCQINMTNNNNNNNMNNKRRHVLLGPTQDDGPKLLAEKMSQLTTDEKPAESNDRHSNDDKNSKFDKYLGQLQEAIVEFVRTNNPSRLFRRTRLLLVRCEENPPPLDDAIRHGHINLALRLIEQVIDMSGSNSLLERENNDGETPLLLAAKFNHWILIEAILKKRLDLIEKTDRTDNNILHLLANVSEDQANETIKNVLALLSNDIQTNLLNKKNKDDQTPIEIAQAKNNLHYVFLLQNS